MTSSNSRAVKVYVSLVNGGAMDFTFPQEFLVKLDRLEADGYAGKDLIDELITDDWGPPPQVVRIVGVHPNGKHVDRKISYD